MSWDWSRSATWSSSSPADQSRSMRKPRPPLRVAVVGDEEHDGDEDAEKEGEEDAGGGGDEGWHPSASVAGGARPAAKAGGRGGIWEGCARGEGLRAGEPGGAAAG
jgi:hypothetical protein